MYNYIILNFFFCTCIIGVCVNIIIIIIIIIITGEGLVCLASSTCARGMSGMFGLRNILHNKIRLLTCYTNHDVTVPALTKNLI